MKRVSMLIVALLTAGFVVTASNTQLSVRQIYDITSEYVNASGTGEAILEKLKNEGWDVKRVTNITPLPKGTNLDGAASLPANFDMNAYNAAEGMLQKLAKDIPNSDKGILEQHYRFVIGFKKINGENVYVISFTGTPDDYSWIHTDLLALPDRWEKSDEYVHLGFHMNMETCNATAEMQDFFKKILDDPNPTLIITGHSMGAGIAPLEAAYMAEHKIVKSPKDIHLVSWAEPPSGWGNFGPKHLNDFGMYHNIANTYDPIPVLPFVIGYRPHGKMIGISFGPVDHPTEWLQRHGFSKYQEYINTIPY